MHASDRPSAGAGPPGPAATPDPAARPTDPAARPTGPQVVIRRISVGDASDLEHFYADLDPETRWLRFHAATAGLSHRQSTWFCRPDRDRHEGFVGAIHEDGFPERIVAHLCVEPASPTEAEVALVVAPGFQGQGTGRRMAEEAVAWARRDGIRTLKATMLVGNEPIRRLLTTLNLPTRWTTLEAGTCELSIDLSAEPGPANPPRVAA